MGEIKIAIPTDESGLIGRECPKAECKSYFKLKIGTGLKGKDLPCHCPYCGHVASVDQFWTKEQLEYITSVAHRQVAEVFTRDLKRLEFDHKPKGSFGIGMSMTVTGGRPIPIRYYQEQTLETHLVCSTCTLVYSVFGVFAYCPDCGTHNSLQILEKNLELITKQLHLAETQEDRELRTHLLEDALENCVSAFDAFARELCRVRSSKSSDPEKAGSLSFQNLPRAATRLKALFGFDFEQVVSAQDWTLAHRFFMRRHLLAHRAGVIDQAYLDATGESARLLGRRLEVEAGDIEALTITVGSLARGLVVALSAPT